MGCGDYADSSSPVFVLVQTIQRPRPIRVGRGLFGSDRLGHSYNRPIATAARGHANGDRGRLGGQSALGQPHRDRPSPILGRTTYTCKNVQDVEGHRYGLLPERARHERLQRRNHAATAHLR